MAKASQAVILENEFYIIKAPNGKVLEVKNFNTENGAAIQLWSYAGHPWQQWQFVDAGEGRWRIRNRFTGKFIDLALGGVVEGTWLHQWGRTSGLSQCWELESTRNGRTRIAFYPLTGRTHQIRVHFAALGHPLLGDTLYNKTPGTFPRQALHSASLSFVHPITGEPLNFHAPLPEDMQNLLT